MKKVEFYAADAQGYTLDKRGIFKLPAPRVPFSWDGEYGVQQLRVVAPKSFTSDEAMAAIEAGFFYDHCSHEHDCCGCVRSFVYTIKRTKKRREFMVSVSHSRNI